MARPAIHIRLPLLTFVGFCLGSALAGTQPDLVLDKATLFQSMRTLHLRLGINVILPDSEDAKRVAVVANGPPLTIAKKVAQQFGHDTVTISGIVVIREALPSVTTPAERLAAARQRIGDPQALRDYYQGVRTMSQRLAAQVPAGQTPFTSLTDSQRQEALDLLRAGRSSTQEIILAQLATSYDQWQVQKPTANETPPSR